MFFVITRLGSKRTNKRHTILGGYSRRSDAAQAAHAAVLGYQGGHQAGLQTKTKNVQGSPCIQGYVAYDGSYSAWVEKGYRKLRRTLTRAVRKGDLSPELVHPDIAKRAGAI